ncbi:caspase-1-A-like isoform X2 [Epinephelus moara]|uniref:caspase-1-A-like isoform X2 n=1 Tax=Epinephelus moara TaxID=300413 RepID=UPI00214F54C4|nr:caspase-1-A-like isoform X2 [Epinephelus moara]
MADELARVRRKFVDKVSKVLIKQLLDDLLDDGVLNDGQKDSIVEEYSTTADKARVLIDTVKKKGDEASRKLIAHIHSRDSTLYSELGLSCVQPAQPAAVRLSEQEWSITLNPATESFWMDKVKDNNVSHSKNSHQISHTASKEYLTHKMTICILINPVTLTL